MGQQEVSLAEDIKGPETEEVDLEAEMVEAIEEVKLEDTMEVVFLVEKVVAALPRPQQLNSRWTLHRRSTAELLLQLQ